MCAIGLLEAPFSPHPLLPVHNPMGINARWTMNSETSAFLLKRTAAEKQPITSRLAKIEGQVRAIRQMIEEGRYCGDELMLSNAVTAAMA